MPETKKDADVIVVGAGIAGMVAALELLDAGQEVILLDRDQESEMGGLARWAFGGMFFADSPVQRRMGIRDSVDLALRDWNTFAEFGPEDEWGQKWAEQFVHFSTPHAYDWLRQLGLRFFPVVHWVERGLFQPGNSVPRFHLLWGTGWELARVVEKRLRKHKFADRLYLKFRHRVTDLIMQHGRVSGVRGTREENGEPFEWQAGSVIIATGGINGNIARVKANWHPDLGQPPERILNGSHPYALGDMHDASRRISGVVTHLNRQWNYAAGVLHPNPRHPEHGLSLIPPRSALWLNYRGERIGPIPLVAGYDTRFLVERICREDKKYSWMVLNQRIAQKELAISGSEHNPAVRDKRLLAFLRTLLFGNRALVSQLIEDCEDVVIADTIAGLARRMNEITGTQDVDTHLLRAAIERYDTNVGRKPKFHNDEQLRRIAHLRQYRGDRIRISKYPKINDPKAYPLIAIRTHILSRKSLGGIQTDLKCRVLSYPRGGRQEPIPGLYAVGEAAGFGGGGLHGLRALEGTFLSACVITGRVAARSIAGVRLMV